jgi:hypothetical protein
MLAHYQSACASEFGETIEVGDADPTDLSEVFMGLTGSFVEGRTACHVESRSFDLS